MIKKITAILLSFVLVAAFFGCAKKEEKIETTSEPTSVTEAATEPVAVKKKKASTANPLTGEKEFNKKAVGVRPVAIVVENLSPARPQWAIGSSDIIVEGEVEGGISRMLWLYADYTAVPEKVGPIRSARPSFVMFSEFFDSIFVHWGGSHNNGSYVGGYGVLSNESVAHIDGMKGGPLFGRDTTRSTSVEHRGILNGDKLPDAIKNLGRRTKIKKKYFSYFKFNKAKTEPGKENAESLNCTFSSRTDTRRFTYGDDGLYHTQDWRTDVAFQNVIILMDKTTYITVPYKGSSTTYLNYTLKKGTGYYASMGKYIPITWSVDGYKLTLRDADGKNKIKLNKGKSYIGLASSNNGGSVTF